MGLKGSDLISWHQTSRDKLRAQKSPQGLRRVGLRTSSDDSGNHRWRILGWRPCALFIKYMIYYFFIDVH
jgi:hypothetical protein